MLCSIEKRKSQILFPPAKRFSHSYTSHMRLSACFSSESQRTVAHTLTHTHTHSHTHTHTHTLSLTHTHAHTHSHTHSLSHTLSLAHTHTHTHTHTLSHTHTHTHTHTPRSSNSRKQLLRSSRWWWWWPGSGLWITPLFWLPVSSLSFFRMWCIWHGSRGRRGQRSALTGLSREGMWWCFITRLRGTFQLRTPCARVLKHSCDWTQRERDLRRWCHSFPPSMTIRWFEWFRFRFLYWFSSLTKLLVLDCCT